MLKFSKAVEGYLINIASGNYAQGTVELYRQDLAKAADFLGDPDLDAITVADLERFMLYLKTDYKPVRLHESDRPLAGATRDNYWKALRSFWRWAAEVFDTRNPALKLQRPLFRSDEVQPFSEVEVKRMLAHVEVSRTFKRAGTREYHLRRPAGLRDRAVLMTLLDTGIRIGELCRLEIRDIDMGNGTLHVRPYGSGRKTKPRLVYLSKSSLHAIWLTLAKRETDNRPEDRLFDVSPITIRKMMDSLSQRSGVAHIHPHRFRHTFAIEYLRNGGDIYTLQRLLGHASLKMVSRYLAIAQSDIGEAHRRASPVDRWRL